MCSLLAQVTKIISTFSVSVPNLYDPLLFTGLLTFMQQIFIENILWARLHVRHWGEEDGQHKQGPMFTELTQCL